MTRQDWSDSVLIIGILLAVVAAAWLGIRSC